MSSSSQVVPYFEGWGRTRPAGRPQREDVFARLAARSRAERAAREPQEGPRALVDAMLAAVLTFGPDGRVLSANRAAEQMFGGGRRELLGTPGHQLFLATCSDTDMADCLDAPSCAHGADVLSLPGNRVTHRTGVRRNGEQFPVELSLFDFQAGGERHVGASVRDLSGVRQAEDTKKQLVSTVSHELRTPLTSIRGSLGLLASGLLGPLPEEARDIVAVADRNCVRLLGLLNDILDFERLEHGRMELTVAPTPVADAVRRSEEAVRAMADDKGIELRLSASDGTVMADGDRLVQVLVNLLSNAIKFSARGGVVLLAVQPHAGRVLFSVADHGRGIPAHLQEAVFDPFRQVEAADARNHGGSGLGLAISRALVQQQAGQIGVESLEGSGSTFWVDLPAAAA